MTLTTVLIRVAIVAVILTLITYFAFKKKEHPLMSYVQNYCGAFFIFSGYVKLVDPLGLAYKMEQYFGEFETHFSWFAPIFPFLAKFALAFSVFIIVFEMVLGVMLILGSKPKLTSWLFFGLVAFFTVLTGFTYLTGHLTGDATFFEFGKWGEWVETNMKVTDCGCFGDYIKLKPYISFMKDVGLMVPAIYFLFRSKDMHQLFTSGVRGGINTLAWVGLTLFAFSNFFWDIPGQDFRPFKNGINIPQQKVLEGEAQSNAPVSYSLTNKSSGENVVLEMNDYLKVYKDYPKAEWDIDQIRGEPSIPFTKISEFEVGDAEGNDMTESILSDPNYSFVVVAYKLYHDVTYESVIYNDTTWVSDTIDNVAVRRVANVEKKTTQKGNYIWDKSYQERYQQYITPLAEAAQKQGMKTAVLTKLAENELIVDFQEKTPAPYPFYTGDDIMLKTIVRSNPGVLLMKNGTIIKKWHYKKLPSFDEIKRDYMK